MGSQHQGRVYTSESIIEQLPTTRCIFILLHSINSNETFIDYRVECLKQRTSISTAITVAPPTQGTWRSNDYVNAVRLVDDLIFSMERARRQNI